MVITGSGSRSAIEHVTKGTYQRDTVALEGQNWAQGTEFEIPDLAAVILADTADKDELFSWIRGQVFVYDNVAGWSYEWAIIKCDVGDGLQDLNDNSATEILHKEGRLFARGLAMTPGNTYGVARPIKFELFNVNLRYGEELRLVIRPLKATSAGGGYVYGIIEWRQVGV